MIININSKSTISYLPVNIILSQLKEKLQPIDIPYEIICIKNTKVDTDSVYITKGTLESNATNDNTLYVYIDAYVYGDKVVKQYSCATLYGYKQSKEIYVYGSTQASTTIISPENIQIAEYINNTLIVHYDIFETNSIEASTDILAQIINDYVILSTLTEEEIKQIKYDRIMNNIIEVLNRTQDRLLKEEQDKLSTKTKNIAYYTDKLSLEFKEQSQIMKRMQVLDGTTKERQAKIIKELQQILTLDKINDIKASVDGKSIIVITKILYGYTEHNRCFKLAPYNIELDFVNGAIRFDCPELYKRRSCWSNKCPHPHISNHGEACFGNIASTVAQLLADVELFALVTILINYLENINVDDVAGAYCTNWDEVDPNTLEVIKEGRINKPSNYFINEGTLCAICNEHSDDMVYCEHCSHYICSNCAIYIEDVGEWGCMECDDVEYCENCGHYYTSEYMETCERCGERMCKACVVEKDRTRFCSDECAEEYFKEVEDVLEEVEEETTVDEVIFDTEDTMPHVACTWCRTNIPETELYTCEICGRQGCSECIQMNRDGIWKCPECREGSDI